MSKKSFLGAIQDKTSLKEKSGISGVFTSTTEKPSPVHKPVASAPDPDEPTELRQSFIIMSDDLDTLKDYVYMKKIQGDPSFSQKEALHLSLQMLFDTEKNIPARPEKVKQQEIKRSKSLSRFNRLK